MKKDKFKIKSVKEDYVIGEDAAVEQIMSFLEFHKIDVEMYEEKQRKNFEMVLEKLVQFIRLGYIKFTAENGKITVTQLIGGPEGSRDNDLVYKNFTGEIAEEADGFDEKQQNAKMHAIVGALTGAGSGGIKKLSGKDYSASQCLSGLFLSI